MEMYPVLEIERNTTANRFYAFPIIGILVKFIMLIPVFFWLICVSIALFFITVLINPFIVLFTGKYWQTAYNLNMGYMRLYAKILAYIYGLTDKYPYFKLSIPDFKFEMPCPEHPSKFFAIPLLGGMVRIFILVPFLFFTWFVTYASQFGMVGSFAKVLFKGEYPESTYQFSRDTFRLIFAQVIFTFGLSDDYPSFEIDFKNHKGIKFFLLSILCWYYLYMYINLIATMAFFGNKYQQSPTVENYNFNQVDVNNTGTDQEFNQFMQQLQQEAVKQQQQTAQ